MTPIQHSISVDIQKHAKRQIVYMKQGDAMSRELLIFFYNGGVVWSVPSEITSVSLSYCKADKVHGCYDHIVDEVAYVFNSGRTSVTMAIHPQVLTAAGNVICELKLCNASGHALNTFNFVINCEQSPHAMGQKSEGYWNNVFDGATFTPQISSDGVLSWTNDKDLPNPDAVNLNSALKTGDLNDLDTTEKSNLVAAINEVLAVARGTPIATATPATESSDDYAASGDDLPVVQKSDGEQHIRPVGKGCQVVFIPTRKNLTTAPTLAINDGEEIAIKLRSSSNQGGNDSRPDATVSVPIGALQRGVPYTMTFCGKFWLLDSMIGGIGGGGGEVAGVVTPEQIEGTHFLNLYDNDYGAANYRPNVRYDHINRRFVDDSLYWSSYDIPLTGGKTYTMSFKPYVLAMFDGNGNYIGNLTFNSPSVNPYTFEIPEEYPEVVCVFSIRSGTIAAGSNVSIVEGSTAGDADAPHKAKIEWLYLDVAGALEGMTFGTDKLADGAVTTPKLADGAVTTPKLADGAVTPTKVSFVSSTVSSLFDASKAIENAILKSYGSDKGVVVTAAGYATSDWMPVAYGHTYYSYLLNLGQMKYSAVSAPYQVYEYASDHSFIAAATLSLHAESNKSIVYSPSTENVAYVRMSFRPLADMPFAFFTEHFSLMVRASRSYLDGIAPTIEGHHVGDFLVTLGDSITRGCSNGETLPDGTVLPNGGQIPMPYGKYAAMLKGMDYVNFGVDGATVATVIARINSQDFLAGLPEHPNIITVMIGTNDMAQVPLGTESDVYDASNLTYYGGLKEIARLLSETYMGTTIVFITPLRPNASKREYVDAMRYVADLYDIPCMDMHKVLRCFQQNSNGDYYISDYYNGLHPNQAGHIRMGKALAGFLNTI